MKNQTRKVDIIVSVNQSDIDELEDLCHKIRTECLELKKKGVVPKSTIKKLRNSVIKGCIFSLGMKALSEMSFLDFDRYCKEKSLYEREH